MNYDKTDRALAALDLSAEQAHLAKIAQHAADTEAAYDRGQAQAAQLARDLTHVLDAQRDGEKEAAALRDGTDIATIAKTPDTIRGEREAVLAGMRTLNTDMERLGKDRQAVRDQATVKLAAVFDSAIIALDEEARILAARLAQIFADAETIRAASHSLAAVQLSTHLRDVVDEAAVSNLIGRSKGVSASSELVQVLTQYREEITVAGGSLQTQHRTARM